MKPGDTCIIVDDAASKSISPDEWGKMVMIISVWFGQAEVQIEGMGPVGRRRVFTCDLEPAGQLEMRL